MPDVLPHVIDGPDPEPGKHEQAGVVRSFGKSIGLRVQGLGPVMAVASAHERCLGAGDRNARVLPLSLGNVVDSGQEGQCRSEMCLRFLEGRSTDGPRGKDEAKT